MSKKGQPAWYQVLAARERARMLLIQTLLVRLKIPNYERGN